jgi:hypothetical protein
MTDRIRHLTITLDEDMRDDDIKSIVSAIEHVRGVADVLPNIVTAQDLLARQAVRAEVQQQLHEAVEGVFRQRELRARIKGER